MALTLAKEMQQARPGLQFLLTSGTRTSAKMLEGTLQDNQRHQFLPVDTPLAMGRFLDHWRPDLAVLLESEIWPNLIRQCKRRDIALTLINARMNEKSRQSWKHRVRLGKFLFGQIDGVTAADRATADFLKELLGREVLQPGNLKLLAGADAPNAELLQSYQKQLAQRPVWLAVSSHAGEDEILIAAHQQIQKKIPDAFLILVPRHPERGAQIARLLEQAGLAASLRSQGEACEGSVLIADTIGEIPLWLALCGAVFMAGSLTGKGHNPVEAVVAERPIVVGPGIESFQEMYLQLMDWEGVHFAENAREIAGEMIDLLGDPALPKQMTQAATEWLQNTNGQTAGQTLSVLWQALDGGKDASA
jgi:3-deoxy-D-manno-octulosonic-acid transferase